MCKYAVTQAEYESVVGKNPSQIKGSQLPVETVSWYDAVEYCNALSRKEGLTPCYSGRGKNITCNWKVNGYRLPTEAEWEYAAKGGINRNSDSNNIDEVEGKSLRIFDMIGNVMEWCWDWYDDNYYDYGPKNNPIGATEGSFRVYRGGLGYGCYDNSYISFRCYGGPKIHYYNVGFRVVRSLN